MLFQSKADKLYTSKRVRASQPCGSGSGVIPVAGFLQTVIRVLWHAREHRGDTRKRGECVALQHLPQRGKTIVRFTISRTVSPLRIVPLARRGDFRRCAVVIGNASLDTAESHEVGRGERHGRYRTSGEIGMQKGESSRRVTGFGQTKTGRRDETPLRPP